MTARLTRLGFAPGMMTLALLAGCTSGAPQRPQPIAAPAAMPAPTGVSMVGDTADTVFIGGETPVPAYTAPGQPPARRGDIRISFPAADVGVVAKAVLGDLLKLGYTIAPGVSGNVSLVTPAPIARSAVLPAFETALKNAGLALVADNGGFVIMPVGAAQASGLRAPDGIGYASEIISLSFINADELKKLLDSVVPGVVTATDAAHNTLTIAGTSGQRSSARDLVRQFDVNWLRSMSFAYLVPQRTDSRLIVPELEKLINAADAPTRGLVRLIAMEKLNGIIAVSTQRQYLEDVKRWVDVLDREGTSNEARLFVYRVQNGRARDLVRTLNAAFGKSGSSEDSATNADPFASPTAANDAQRAPASTAPRTSSENSVAASGGPASLAARISSDEINNAVIVFGSPRDFAIVEDALRKLDIPPFQVLIEAAIIEVSLTDELRFGVQWNFQTGDSNFALGQGTTATPTRILPGFSYFYGGNNINATLNALEERTNVNVVSAPKLVVLNNQTAALQVGDQVPVLTQSSQSTVGNSAVIDSVEYRDTGVILKVTPRVNSGGLVLLDVAQEVSDVQSSANTLVRSPTIATRRIATSVAVQDGQVIALGGLFRDSKSFGKNGLPILSRIPVLGSLLFGNTTNMQKRTELIILLKPRVLRTADDSLAITEELRAKLRTLEPFKTKGQIP